VKRINLNLHPHVGTRCIKTAAAAMVCALLYLLLGRSPAFACIGVIFGMGRGPEDSRLHGGNRFFGTLFGGLLGMGLFCLYLLIYPDGVFRAPMLLFLGVGVVLLILVCQLFCWEGGVQPGGVVLCILLFNTPPETYLTYCISRIVDTGIGVLIALAVGRLLPRERLLRWLQKWHLAAEDKE